MNRQDEKPSITRGQLEDILRIERERAALMARLKEAILGGDERATLALAREVVGLPATARKTKWDEQGYARVMKLGGTVHERRLVDAINVLLEVVRTSGRPTEGRYSTDTPEKLLCELLAKCKAAAIGLEAELDELPEDRKSPRPRKGAK